MMEQKKITAVTSIPFLSTLKQNTHTKYNRLKRNKESFKAVLKSLELKNAN